MLIADIIYVVKTSTCDKWCNSIDEFNGVQAIKGHPSKWTSRSLSLGLSLTYFKENVCYLAAY